ncbi:TerB family tellurite resistance protein [Candidatus Pelagibacter sp.]|nr:TerB family tellurite resistance protein [Candidatus Pelagibacter sp.]
MFFNKDNIIDENDELIKVGALLIHAAKIDEDYTKKEAEIIKQALLKISPDNKDIQTIIMKAEDMEKNSNQILDFTREIKAMEEKNKIKIIKTLWEIIFSNKKADIYETNLMRRLAGLLYIDSKIMGDIKEQIKNENLE